MTAIWSELSQQWTRDFVVDTRIDPAVGRVAIILRCLYNNKSQPLSYYCVGRRWRKFVIFFLLFSDSTEPKTTFIQKIRFIQDSILKIKKKGQEKNILKSVNIRKTSRRRLANTYKVPAVRRKRQQQDRSTGLTIISSFYTHRRE